MLANGLVDELGPGPAANRNALDAQIRRADELQLAHAELPLHVAQQLGQRTGLAEPAAAADSRMSVCRVRTL